MKRVIYRRLTAELIVAFIVVTGTMTAFAQEKPSGQTISLPGYFQELLDRKDVKVDCVAMRDDLGIEWPSAPIDVNRYAKLLTDLKLQAAVPQSGTLVVKAPFTLRFTHEGETDAFAFSGKGVLYGGTLYLPAYPAALAAFYENDHQQFFSAEYYSMGRNLTFAAEQVASVELRRNHYNDSISMNLTAREPITALLTEQKTVLVRNVGNKADILLATGDSANETIYTLRDGTVIRLGDGGGKLTLQTGAQPEATYRTLRGAGGRAVFDALLNSYDGVPQLTAVLGGEKPEQIYQTAFRYDGETKSYKNDIPMEYGYDKHVYLPIRADNTARLTFSETPSVVTAQLFRAEAEKLEVCRSATVAAGGTLALPSEPGNYGLRVHAVFPKGAVDYFLGFVVSDLPEFFDSIEYGNDEGGVTVTRNDLGVSVTGGQNRKYVELLQELNLVPATDGVSLPISQIQKPITLAFSCEGHPDQKFSFSTVDSKILYNSKPYRAQNYDAIQRLYTPSDSMKGETLSDDTKGFLSAQCTTFEKLYPLKVADIAAIKVEQKHLYRRSFSVDDQGKTTYGFTLDTLSAKDLGTAEFTSALNKIKAILLAKEEKDADAYDFGKYTAYTLTTKGGREFSLDRRLTIDGKASGYYLLADG